MSHPDLRAREYSLIVIGEGRLRSYYEHMARRLGLSDRVDFRNYLVERDDLLNIYQSADILVAPSTSEGLPRVVIEAAASSLPIIGSNVGGIPEIIHGHALVEPGNSEELRTRIISYLDSQSIRKVSRK